MAAPPLAAVGKAGATAGRLIAGQVLARRRGGDNEGGPGAGWAALLLVAALPVGLAVGLVVLVSMLGAAQQQTCGGGSADGVIPGDFSGPGSLGGAAGTGIPRPLVERVRQTSPYAGSRITPGTYTATAYGPPWGGIQGAGAATSGGLPINGGAPRWYMIAVNPRDISHGTFVYVWPNPFGWKGPFFAADTGGAINSRRIDFYDWRGRASQNRWGIRTVQASDKPIVPADPSGGDVATSTNPSADNRTQISLAASSSSTVARSAVVIGGGRANGSWRMLSGDLDFRPAVGDALEQMAEATGTRIYVREGGRTLEEQQRYWDLYQAGKGNLAAPPNPNAPHVRGVAADISPGRERFGAIAAKFSLRFTVPSESWHVELVGPAAQGSAANTSLAGLGDCGGDVSVASDLNVTRSYVVRAPRRFQSLPRDLVTAGYDDQCDARIVPDVVYFLRRYNLKAHDCRATGHATHGDGLSIDIVPAADEFPQVGDTSKMRAWKRLEAGIRALGWRPSCAGNGCIGQGLVPAIYAIFYNGFTNHGDPAAFTGSCGCPHVHIRWMSVPPSGGVPYLAPPVPAVRVFTPPAAQDSST